MHPQQMPRPRPFLPLLLALVVTAAACTSTLKPSKPWGDAEVRIVIWHDGCPVYGLVSDPEHTYWPDPDCVPTSPVPPPAEPDR